MNAKSIFNAIYENMDSEGKLSHGFSLPFEEVSPTKFHFMPGAKDGIGIFHFGLRRPKKVAKKIVRLIKSDLKKESRSSLIDISELLNKHGALSVVDHVLHLLRENQQEVDAKLMVDYSCQIAFQNDDEELVKLGIALLGLTDLSNESEIIEKLIILALYEEFTLYVDVAVLNYKNRNDILFKIAQKVEGWGKIHTVERLEPTSDEIRDWILRNGCVNAVMNAYLGLECAYKGNLINVLRQDSLDNELFESVSVIIEALLDEGPANGISSYEDAAEALQRYLIFATDRAVLVKHLWNILNIQSWLEGAEIANRDILRRMCDKIVMRESWNDSIRNALNSKDEEQFFYASNAASRLNIDVSDLMLKAIKQDPVKYCGYLSVVYRNPEYARQLTNLYEEVLPLENMATGMGSFLFPENLTEEHICLRFLLQELIQYPKMGERLIQTGLQSPVVGERIWAYKNLQEWSKLLNQNLYTFSPYLYGLLKDTARLEVDSELKKNMKRLLHL